nr:hypothetical protein [Mycobacterium scrofulaceum]
MASIYQCFPSKAARPAVSFRRGADQLYR